MNESGYLSFDELSQFVNSNPDAGVRIGVTDVDGVLRGKIISGTRFLEAFRDGLSLCDCTLGWDVADRLYENGGRNPQVGWQHGFPDAPLRIIDDTVLETSDKDGVRSLLALSEFSGAYEPLCPRSLLRRSVERLKNAGFTALCGFEYEFTLFRETNRTLHDKGFQRLETLYDGNFGYSGLKFLEHMALFEQLRASCRRYGITLDSLHTENGPGIWEAALPPGDALLSADRAVLFKLAVKQFAREQGLTACFMAKWSTKHQGQGGHIHVSLRDREGEPVFGDPDDRATPGPTMLSFIAGQQRLMPEVMPLVAPTINSYKRLVPGTWAPTFATWGKDNRTCALRVVGRTGNSLRVEYRVPGADANPYLALGAALSTGMFGIEGKLSPTPPIQGNAYEQDLPDYAALPDDLRISASRLSGSKHARILFGDAFVDHFVLSREWEHRQFSSQVTNWELERYAEII